MPSAFANLKKNRANVVEKLNTAFKDAKKGNYDDDAHEYWTIKEDKAGNGYAEIRFLPGAEGDDLPWVKMYSHSIKGPGGQWYIENSLTTIGKEDPVGELNGKLWNSGVESDKEIARKQKRRLQYTSNIYVVSDPTNPDNNGKVFKYKYGKKVYDKIQDVMNPEFPDEQPCNPFDLWEGATFKLKIRQVDGYRNYDKSEFSKPSVLLDDDDKLEEVFNSQYILSGLVADDKFKTYTELLTKLNRVLQIEAPLEKKSPPTPAKVAKVDDDIPFDTGSDDKSGSLGADDKNDDDDDDPMAIFNKLANAE